MVRFLFPRRDRHPSRHDPFATENGIRATERERSAVEGGVQLRSSVSLIGMPCTPHPITRRFKSLRSLARLAESAQKQLKLTMHVSVFLSSVNHWTSACPSVPLKLGTSVASLECCAAYTGAVSKATYISGLVIYMMEHQSRRPRVDLVKQSSRSDITNRDEVAIWNS